jgi:hypothetical protein
MSVHFSCFKNIALVLTVRVLSQRDKSVYSALLRGGQLSVYALLQT